MKLLPEKFDIVASLRDRLDFLRQEEQRIAEEIRAHKAEVRNRNIAAAECAETISMGGAIGALMTKQFAYLVERGPKAQHVRGAKKHPATVTTLQLLEN